MSNEAQNPNEEEKKEKRRRFLIIIAIILILAGLAMIGQKYVDTYLSSKEQKELSSIATIATSVSQKKITCPIDFDTLQKTNDEIYAWLKVPGTKVDHPLVQSKVSDDFYLRHKAEDKSYSSSGAIYTQSLNTKKFDDRVTVIYGHNNFGDTMFTTLHYFEKQDFFDSHKEFYIYTPEAKLTYKIVSAFKYDDRHILNSFDFQDDGIFESFINMIQDPKSSVEQVRSPLGKDITINDNIVVLSTCVTNQKSSRYLVCGVLTNNERYN